MTAAHVLTVVTVSLSLSLMAGTALGREASPCDYLPEALVRQAFAIAPTQTLAQRAGASCRWERPGGARPFGVAFNFSRPAKVTSATIETLFQRLQKGMTREVAGRTVTLAPKQVEWVSGVGDKAFWNHDQNQLAVYAKARLFYVTVTLDGLSAAERRDGAMTVARAVVDAL
jgi:hypothetical protein